MVAVIFEATLAGAQVQTYFDMAAGLQLELQGVAGFISVERFQSLACPEKFVSLSFWENEMAVQEWRARELHRAVQLQGSDQVLPGTACVWRWYTGMAGYSCPRSAGDLVHAASSCPAAYKNTHKQRRIPLLSQSLHHPGIYCRYTLFLQYAKTEHG